MRSSSREHGGEDGTIYPAHVTATASTLVHVNLLRDVSSYFDGSRDSRTDGKGDSTDPQHRRQV